MEGSFQIWCKVQEAWPGRSLLKHQQIAAVFVASVIAIALKFVRSPRCGRILVWRSPMVAFGQFI